MCPHWKECELYQQSSNCCNEGFNESYCGKFRHWKKKQGKLIKKLHRACDKVVEKYGEVLKKLGRS